ncbi:hypothetical protein Fot_34837 [Forsythia ovata]|uniref:Uncharacterized protein n=1 Tax=Forsythia ovata TaxID=205694 RepID=A0ABD1SJU0_9LAMI
MRGSLNQRSAYFARQLDNELMSTANAAAVDLSKIQEADLEMVNRSCEPLTRFPRSYYRGGSDEVAEVISLRRYFAKFDPFFIDVCALVVGEGLNLKGRFSCHCFPRQVLMAHPLHCSRCPRH